MGVREREGWERRRQFTLEFWRILFEEWDPIGVSEMDGPDDEYDSYVSGALGVISNGGDEAAVFAYLRMMESERMGLPDLPPDRARRAARSLLELDRRVWGAPDTPERGFP